MSADFLHHGHINLLQKAKKYGNIIANKTIIKPNNKSFPSSRNDFTNLLK